MLAQRLEDGLALDLRQALGIRGFDRRGRSAATARTLAGRCSGRMSSPSESSAARSIALRSSRTFPGQA